MKVFYPFHRNITTVFILLFAVCHATKAQIPMPKHEVRAVWLTTIGGLDWPHSYARSEASAEKQQRELCNILDKLRAANVNTVLLQTRIRGTVIYPSLYEPWDGCLSGIPGKSPGYDALKYAIDECHKRGMELHAWVVTIPVGKWNQTGCQRLRKQFPKAIRKIGDEGYMNPERDETALFLGKICREIAENYDVDGIHLDYIRYPETWNIKVPREQGRKNITSIVRRIHNEVKSVKPWVKLSCSPVGKYDDLTRYWSYGWNAREKVCQDAQAWLRDGLMDELFPMMYFRDNQFYPFALDWKENSYGRIISIGLGVYQLSPKEKDWDIDIIKRQMGVLRHHAMGHAYFRSAFFTDNLKNVYDFAAGEIDPYPALVPPMTWQSKSIPMPPTQLEIAHTNGGDQLSWSGAIDTSDGPYLLYNVYASDTWPVDINDAKNLIAMRYQHQSAFIGYKNEAKQLHYAITAMDRYGNESLPINSPKPDIKEYKSTVFLRNNGTRLDLPEKGNAFDADFVAIESMCGTAIAIKPYKGRQIDISDINDGMYMLKSLGKKGVTHRLGYFIIKRKME